MQKVYSAVIHNHKEWQHQSLSLIYANCTVIVSATGLLSVEDAVLRVFEAEACTHIICFVGV